MASRARSPVGPRHHQEARAVVQDGVDVYLPFHPLDAEVVDVCLPERIDVLPLEPLDGLGLPDPADHEAVPLERSMDGNPRDLHPSASEDCVDPQCAPSGIPSAQLEEPVDEVPVDTVGVTSRSTGLVPQPRDAILAIVLAPVSQCPLGDPVKSADFDCSDPTFEVLLDGVQAKSDIVSDQGHPFPGAAICPDNSGGKMS